MKVLVTGGAGYIGSHVVRLLRSQGHRVVVVDDLRQGHRVAVEGVRLVEADCADGVAIQRARDLLPFDSVVHLAADCLVGESMQRPEAYYRNNLSGSLKLLEYLRHMGIRRMVFSSSAATYGEPSQIPILEDHPTSPTNPYGETKLAFERALGWYRQAHGFASVALRYFNAAGAAPGGELGEDHQPETHLIPRLLAVAAGRQEVFHIHGDDYPTADGTCVRDYVHVEDLARAHLLALEALDAGEPGGVFNLGSESGYSVRQVVDAAARVTGQSIATEVGPRRPGDPPSLVASSARIRQQLGWEPRYRELGEILSSAWEWHRRCPRGYGDTVTS